MKLKKYIYLILFFGGIVLFVFSLLPFFRAINDTFWIATLVGFVVSFFAMFCLLYKPKDKEGKIKLNSKYVRKGALVTRAEYDFLQTLRQIEPNKYEVVPQVALVNVIDKKTNTSYRGELFRVCDYCFCDRDTFEPLLLVELNDSSHNRSDRKLRDEKVAAICADAHLPLVTFWLNGDLGYSTVKKTVLKNILK